MPDPTLPPLETPSAEGEAPISVPVNGNRRVALASALLMAGILLSRVLGLLRDRIIAHRFGQGFETDVYNAAFTVPDLLFFLLAGGVFSGAFTPVFTDYISTNREKDAWRIFSVVATTMTLVIGVLIVLGEIFVYPLVARTNPGYAPGKIAATVVLTRILLPAQICFFLGGLMMSTLTARNINSGQAFGPVIYNLGIILGGMFLTNRFGVAGLCWGAVIGAVVGNIGLQMVLLKQSGGRFYPRAIFRHWRHPGVIQVWKLMLPVIFGLALPYVSTIIGRAYASGLGEGPQSALMNANRLFQVPLGVFAQAIAIASLPVMAAHAARGEMPELRKSVVFSLRSILFLTIPSSMVMVTLSLPIIQLLLQSGKFTQADSEMTALVLCAFSVGIFAWSAHSILARGFYALKESRIPVIVGTVVTLFFLPLNNLSLFLTGTQNKALATAGLAMATSVAATLQMLGLLFLLRKRLNGLEGMATLGAVLKMTLAAFSATGVCYMLRMGLQYGLHHLALKPSLSAGIVLAVCLPATALVYVTFSVMLGVREVNVVKRLMGKFKRTPVHQPAG